MEKPRGSIHWTNDHSYFDEAGLVVIGRVKIPVSYLLVVYGIIVVVLFIAGFVVAGGHPSNHDGIKGNSEWSSLLPFAYSLIPALLIGVLIGITAFVKWTVNTFKRANRD